MALHLHMCPTCKGEHRSVSNGRAGRLPTWPRGSGAAAARKAAATWPQSRQAAAISCSLYTDSMLLPSTCRQGAPGGSKTTSAGSCPTRRMRRSSWQRWQHSTALRWLSPRGSNRQGPSHNPLHCKSACPAAHLYVHGLAHARILCAAGPDQCHQVHLAVGARTHGAQPGRHVRRLGLLKVRPVGPGGQAVARQGFPQRLRCHTRVAAAAMLGISTENWMNAQMDWNGTWVQQVRSHSGQPRMQMQLVASGERGRAETAGQPLSRATDACNRQRQQQMPTGAMRTACVEKCSAVGRSTGAGTSRPHKPPCPGDSRPAPPASRDSCFASAEAKSSAAS